MCTSIALDMRMVMRSLLAGDALDPPLWGIAGNNLSLSLWVMLGHEKPLAPGFPQALTPLGEPPCRDCIGFPAVASREVQQALSLEKWPLSLEKWPRVWI
jgi:hypothetical protein